LYLRALILFLARSDPPTHVASGQLPAASVIQTTPRGAYPWPPGLFDRLSTPLPSRPQVAGLPPDPPRPCNVSRTGPDSLLRRRRFLATSIRPNSRPLSTELAGQRQGCNGGDAAACNSLGYAHALGAGAPLDGAKAMALFLQACEAKHANACDSVGEAHEKGWGTKVDPAEALKWYEKACSMGNTWSCDRVKELRRP
jgi:TPR repeat protein